jgi:hypothetical protein
MQHSGSSHASRVVACPGHHAAGCLPESLASCSPALAADLAGAAFLSCMAEGSRMLWSGSMSSSCLADACCSPGSLACARWLACCAIQRGSGQPWAQQMNALACQGT